MKYAHSITILMQSLRYWGPISLFFTASVQQTCRSNKQVTPDVRADTPEGLHAKYPLSLHDSNQNRNAPAHTRFNKIHQYHTSSKSAQQLSSYMRNDVASQ
jgi:hypothetical protein